MALEAVVYPLNPFNPKNSYSLGQAGLGYDFNLQGEDEPLPGILETKDNENHNQQVVIDQLQGGGFSTKWDANISSPDEASTTIVDHQVPFPGMVLPRTAMELEPPPPAVGRRKRRVTKSRKNKEEIENQRMTHIAVERNRRKQMNQYLSVLRSLMPPSYAQRGDQASIIGGAINYVKELEYLLQNLEAHKKSKHHQGNSKDANGLTSLLPFANFFTFPQYSTRSTQPPGEPMVAVNKRAAAADIEVNTVESHANLKILSKKRPRQLVKLVGALQSLRLSILHLNVTTAHQMVLYSISVKVEEGCLLNTVDEIAAAVNQMLHRIEEEAAFS